MGPGMGMGLGMRQELKQQLQLAPRMIQSMEILQLPVMALQERIEAELQENPVLELRQPADENAPDVDGSATEEENAASDNGELIIDSDGSFEEDFDRLNAINEDWADHFNEESRPSVNRIEEESERKHQAEVNVVSRPQDLLDYLDDQLGFLDLPPEQLRLARHVLTFIDKTGYLQRVEYIYDEKGRVKKEIVTPVSLEEIAESFDQPVTTEEVEAALKVIQKLDPPGVGARDLRECLLLQLTPELPHVEVLRVLIENHLEDIQHNRLPVIQKKTGFDLATIQEAIEVLKHLNPKPGSQFVEDNVQYVVPDIAVEKTDDGDYEVRLLDDWTPRLYLSRRYQKIAQDRRADPKTREFLRKKLQSARWLIEAIEQRRSTLLKVTRAIIDRQRAFLDHGPEFIEPLKMQQIADVVGVHVTTVSRAVDDKWVQTPRGVFPLKRFFGGGTQTANGEEVAYEAIKQKLLDLIQNEDKSSPLSDEEIVKRLNEAGYPVKRRTVTKYRKMLGIPSSRQRKVWT